MDDDALSELGRRWAKLHQGGSAKRRDEGRARLLSAVRQQQRGRPALPHWTWAAAALLVVVTIGIAWSRSRPAAVRFFADDQPGQLHAQLVAREPTLLTFPEGTSLQLLAGTRARVEELDARGARMVVEDGHVLAKVFKRPETRWQVDAGPYSVVVTGTQFDVDWNARRERLAVGVSRGSVMVIGPGLGAGKSLQSGEHLEVGAPTGSATPSISIPESAAPKDTAQAQAASSAAMPAEVPPVAPAAIPHPTEVSSASKPRTAAELLVDAQSARRANDLERAREAWQTCRRQYPGTDEAAVSAFWLGRSLPAKAAVDWFAIYLDERPQGALAAEARGRLMEHYVTLGRADSARRVAWRYRQLHPNGPHAGLAEQILEPSSER